MSRSERPPGSRPPAGTAAAAGPSSGRRTSFDRLLALGMGNTARALTLLEEVRKHLAWDEAELDVVLRGAEAAPDPLTYLLNLSKLSDGLPREALAAALSRPDVLAVMGPLLGGSEFLGEQLAKRPDLFSLLFLSEGFRRRVPAGELLREAIEDAERCAAESEVKAALRRIKVREMARIAARDLAGLAPLSEVMEDLSALASAALSGAIRFARRALDERYGAARIDGGEGGGRECGFVVMGMGKLGSLELNFSSDIDLIYLYETDRGMTDGGREGKRVTLHEYFVRLSETITRIVSELTEDGIVFRVDLRLRPEGIKGDLANSLRSAEIYYESWGQTWERGAMIKARPVAGDLALGEEFLRTITPFVYRKYLDFTSIEEIKEMKDRIDAAAARARKGGRDVKLGSGGIREIEFFAQAHQLIYGGKNPDLRTRGTLAALAALANQGIVTERDRAGLEEAYVFLRALEHRIQVFQERQTHVLPQREEDMLRLARAMRFARGDDLLAALDRHTDIVRSVYDGLFRARPHETPSDIPPDAEALLDQELDDAEASAKLSALGFADPGAARSSSPA